MEKQNNQAKENDMKSANIVEKEKRVFSFDLGLLLQIEPILDSIATQDYNGQIFLSVRNNLKQLKSEIKEFVNFRTELIKKYGEKDGKGISIPEGSPNKPIIEKYIEELLESKIEYSPRDIPASVFAKASTSISSKTIDILISIGFLIKDDERVETSMTSSKYMSDFEQYMTKKEVENENKEECK